MKVKYYFAFFVVFVIIFCGGFYTLSSPSSDITLSLYGHNFTQHFAVWLAIGLGIFFAFTLLFFVGNWFSHFTHAYRHDKDFDTLLSQIYAQILKQPFAPTSFKTKHYQTLSAILHRLNCYANLESAPCENAKIDQLFQSLQAIQNGESSSLKLPKESEFWALNVRNQIKSDYKFAHKVLEGDYEDSLKQHAIETLVQNNQMSEKHIQKFLSSPPSSFLAKTLLHVLLQSGYKLPVDMLKTLMLLSSLSKEEYIQEFQTLKALLSPDECIALFESLGLQDQHAQKAYVYVLLDFSMMEKAQEFLHDHEGFTLAQAFIDLKKMGKTYPLEKFF